MKSTKVLNAKMQQPPVVSYGQVPLQVPGSTSKLHGDCTALSGLQEVPELSTRAVLLLHHTDCGAMAAIRHHDQLVSRMKQLLSEWGITTWAVQVGGAFRPQPVHSWGAEQCSAACEAAASAVSGCGCMPASLHCGHGTLTGASAAEQLRWQSMPSTSDNLTT